MLNEALENYQNFFQILSIETYRGNEKDLITHMVGGL